MATKNRLLWSCLRGAPSKMGLLDRGLESFVEFVPLDSDWIVFLFCFFLRKKRIFKILSERNSGGRSFGLLFDWQSDWQSYKSLNSSPPPPLRFFGLKWNEGKEAFELFSMECLVRLLPKALADRRAWHNSSCRCSKVRNPRNDRKSSNVKVQRHWL
jgi:hypothetical protein